MIDAKSTFIEMAMIDLGMMFQSRIVLHAKFECALGPPIGFHLLLVLAIVSLALSSLELPVPLV